MSQKLRSNPGVGRIVLGATLAFNLVGISMGEAHAAPSPVVKGHQNTQYSLVGDLSFSQLGLNFQRRAAQTLEDARMQDSNLDKAVMAQTVRTLYRPDIAGAAYYEISLLAYDTNAPLGCIVLSVTNNEVPVVNVVTHGDSFTQKLISKAQAAGKTASKFFRVDALTFVAEDAQGGVAATLGTLPSRPVNQDSSTGVLMSSTYEGPDVATDVGTLAAGVRYDGDPSGNHFQFQGFSSWGDFKTNFASVFANQRSAQASNGADAWTVENAALQNGEGLRLGQVYDLAFIKGSPAISFTGAGQALVSTQVLTRPGVPGALRISVQNVGANPQPLNVTLTYPGGQTETVKFVVVPDSALGLQSSPGTQRGGASWSSWSSWTTYWAGSSSDQRDYWQMAAGTGPNTSSCYSGCGATAWAMLFGWGDYQASLGDPYWGPRTGLVSGVAPSSQNSVIEDVTWEIRNDIDTFCITGSGATYPWKMDQADLYLAGRTGTSLTIDYNSVGIPETGLREGARDSIKDRDTPAIIGIGWLEHYPLAWGYRFRSRYINILGWKTYDYQREFYVNEGWYGTSADGWVDASTWFDGEIYP